MFEEFTYNGINWKADGYFGCPSPASEWTYPNDVRKEHLVTWIDCFQRSKEGDFSRNHLLVEILLDTVRSPIAASCCDLIGNAGNTQCFERILEELKKARKFYIAELLCDCLYQRGTLEDISTLLDTYEIYSENSESNIITVWISDLLGRKKYPYSVPNEFGSSRNYREAVMNHVSELTAKFSSREEIVFHGKRFSVCALAEYILVQIEQTSTRPHMRQRFEAATGIDCRDFYRHERLQPLAASTIVEGFLESNDTRHFEEGVRYFFGHRIPD